MDVSRPMLSGRIMPGNRIMLRTGTITIASSGNDNAEPPAAAGAAAASTGAERDWSFSIFNVTKVLLRQVDASRSPGSRYRTTVHAIRSGRARAECGARSGHREFPDDGWHRGKPSPAWGAHP